jgi:hypothetical protein
MSPKGADTVNAVWFPGLSPSRGGDKQHAVIGSRLDSRLKQRVKCPPQLALITLTSTPYFFCLSHSLSCHGVFCVAFSRADTTFCTGIQQAPLEIKKLGYIRKAASGLFLDKNSPFVLI